MDESILELHHPSRATEPAANLKLPQRFAPPMSDLDVVKAREQAIPKRTREDTAYCVRVWDEWTKSGIEQGAEIQPLVTMDDSTLQHWLTHFILEESRMDPSILLTRYTIFNPPRLFLDQSSVQSRYGLSPGFSINWI